VVAAYPDGRWTPGDSIAEPSEVYVISYGAVPGAFRVQDGAVTGVSVGTDHFEYESCG
jgi:hypothetical protein